MAASDGAPMLFARRHAENFAMRARIALWPRRSWRRSWQFALLRLSRLKASNEAIAAGFAAGAFAAITPLLGLQIAIAMGLAWVLRVNVASALAGTFVANPLTMPVIYGATFKLGCVLLDHDPATQAALNRLSITSGEIAALWHPVIKPMLAGSIPLGILVAGVSFEIVRVAMFNLRAKRQSQIKPALQSVLSRGTFAL
jgi:uncharacterized protein